MKQITLMLFAVMLSFNASANTEYEFEIKDSYVSSIFGTSEKYKFKVPSAPFRHGEIQLKQDNEVPENFWYNKELKYAKAIRDEYAPLAILIAGTGGNHITPKVKLMASQMYSLGYSVITLPSPSHSNFIVSSSSTSSVGAIENDIKDLKHAIKEVVRQVIEEDEAKISSYVVGGYSLGAAHSAFLSYYADKDKNYPIKFDKVLMVNPPYDILESAIKIDRMFTKYVGNSPEDIAKYYDGLYSTIAETYNELGGIEVGPEFLMEIYKRRNISQEGVKSAIGTAFRFSSADMVFSVDVMRKMGVIVPKDVTIGQYDSLREYSVKSLGYGFEKYAQNMLTEIYNKPLKQLSDETSIKAIEPYLKNSDKIFLMHNANDFILKQGDIEYFKSVFGNRAVIFPYGGHCGNMDHKDSYEFIKSKFKLKEQNNG